MATTRQYPPLELALAGQTALACLLSGQGGQVLAAGRRAVFFRTERGEVFWLTGAGSARHRRGMQINGLLPHCQPGTLYHMDDHRLSVAADFGLAFSGVEIWKAVDVKPGEGRLSAELPALAESLINRLVDRPDMAGLACLLPSILCLVRCGYDYREACRGSAFLTTAWEAIVGLVQADQSRDFARVMSEARKLLGLGEGLTPSGDDFLGGLFFCRQLLGQAYPLVFGRADWDVNELLHEGKSLSNWISFSLLQDHARGHSVEPLHRLAAGLLTGQSPDGLLPAVADLTAIGHSTGWDILTGFLTGTLLAVPR